MEEKDLVAKLVENSIKLVGSKHYFSILMSGAMMGLSTMFEVQQLGYLKSFYEITGQHPDLLDVLTPDITYHAFGAISGFMILAGSSYLMMRATMKHLCLQKQVR